MTLVLVWFEDVKVVVIKDVLMSSYDRDGNNENMACD